MNEFNECVIFHKKYSDPQMQNIQDFKSPPVSPSNNFFKLGLVNFLVN